LHNYKINTPQNFKRKTMRSTNAIIIQPKEETTLSRKEAERGSGEKSTI